MDLKEAKNIVKEMRNQNLVVISQLLDAQVIVAQWAEQKRILELIKTQIGFTNNVDIHGREKGIKEIMQDFLKSLTKKIKNEDNF